MRTRNFRAAARALGLSQAAVSQHVHKLEQSLSARLLVRQARGCSLTVQGANFAPYAESLLRLNARAIAAVAGNCVAVGASSNVGIYYLPSRVKSYMDEVGGPHSVDVSIHPNPIVAEKLEAGEIDVAAMEWWDNRPGYVARAWRREELVVIVPRGHAWSGLQSIRRTQLAGAKILGGEAGTGTGRLLAQYLGDQARDLTVVARLGSTEAVKHAVKAGLGISLVLAGTVAEECRAGTLAAIPLEGESPRKDFYLIHRASLPQTSLPRTFADWLTVRG